MTESRRVFAGMIAALLVCAPLTLAHAQTADEVKASRKCRDAIAKGATKLIKTGLKLVDTCHANRNKGKPVGDCNVLALGEADPKNKFEATRLKFAAAVTKKCAPGDDVRLNYAGGDPVGALAPIIRSAIEISGAALQGDLDLGGDKAKIKCHKAVGKARSAIVNEIAKLGNKCQKALDKVATVFEEINGNCLLQPLKSGPKADTAIAKACGAIVDGATAIGSCTPLPGCVKPPATDTGHELTAATYGTSPCGNGTTDPGEQCDDGNFVDGDGCDSNCTTTACGNGIVTSGEQCDDGNALTTDDCVACQDAVCGDGAVHAGVELCGDSTEPSCLSPGPGTCSVADCTAAGTTRAVTVSFSPPPSVVLGGLSIALDYPEGKVGVPGTGTAAGGRIAVVPSGLSTKQDRDYEVEVVLANASGISSGTFYTVTFDVCEAAAAATIDEFACLIRDASDTGGVPIPVGDIDCTVSFP